MNVHIIIQINLKIRVFVDAAAIHCKQIAKHHSLINLPKQCDEEDELKYENLVQEISSTGTEDPYEDEEIDLALLPDENLLDKDVHNINDPSKDEHTSEDGAAASSATIYRVDAKNIAVLQDTHYACRGAELAILSLYEYTALVTITKMSTEEQTIGKPHL